MQGRWPAYTGGEVPHLPDPCLELSLGDGHSLAVAQHEGQQVAVSILRLLLGPGLPATGPALVSDSVNQVRAGLHGLRSCMEDVGT